MGFSPRCMAGSLGGRACRGPGGIAYLVPPRAWHAGARPGAIHLQEWCSLEGSRGRDAFWDRPALSPSSPGSWSSLASPGDSQADRPNPVGSRQARHLSCPRCLSWAGDRMECSALLTLSCPCSHQCHHQHGLSQTVPQSHARDSVLVRRGSHPTASRTLQNTLCTRHRYTRNM